MAATDRNFRILVIEDNLADIDLLQLLFQQVTSPYELHFARNEDEVTSYLLTASAPPCDLVLMDLNLPMCDGRDLLKKIKANPIIRKIPVIILSTSNSAREIEETYDLGANAFVSKPIQLEKFEKTLRALEAFWMCSAALPTRNTP